VNRPRRNGELEVRVMFEPNRFTKEYLSVAYERAAPKRRRQIPITRDKGRNNRKVACRAGGAL